MRGCPPSCDPEEIRYSVVGCRSGRSRYRAAASPGWGRDRPVSNYLVFPLCAAWTIHRSVACIDRVTDAEAVGAVQDVLGVWLEARREREG